MVTPFSKWLLLPLLFLFTHFPGSIGNKRHKNALSDITLVGSVGTKTFYTGAGSSKLTWMEAQEFCNQEGIAGMQLASIDSAEEEDVVLDYLSDLENSPLVIQFWLSATDFGTEGEFYWTRSGNRVLFNVTMTSDGRVENCLKVQDNAVYFDERCTGFIHSRLWALCEVQSDPNTPSTTTTTLPTTTTQLPSTTTTLPTTTTQLPSTTTTLPNTTTTAEPTTPEITTQSPNTTTTRPPFQCPSEGKHPDPYDCTVFHECVEYNGEFIDYEFQCPQYTNYCVRDQICGDPRDCPCQLKEETVDVLKVHSDSRVASTPFAVNATDLIRVGKVGQKTLYTYRAPFPYFNWIQCLQFCHENEMMLARMENDAERNLMLGYLTGSSPRYFWLSGVDFGSEGDYYWINDGTEISYPIYGNGGRDSNCLYLASSPLYDWSCENHRNADMWPLCQVVEDSV